MYIEAITVCNDYADILAVTAPLNQKHFDRWVVVCSDEDNNTPAICEKFGVECVISPNMRMREGSRGKKKGSFCKGAMINDGLDALAKNDWILHIDADMILPYDFRQQLEESDLDEDTFYGCGRYDVDFHEYTVNPDCKRVLEGGRNVGVGFLQLWNCNSDALIEEDWRYADVHGHAGRDDRRFFRTYWRKDNPKNRAKNLEWLRPLHLVIGGYKQNWYGRTQPVVDDDYEDENENYDEWSPVWEECHGPKKAEEAVQVEVVVSDERPAWIPPWELGKLSPSPAELEWLFNLVADKKPEQILEFGCGATTWAMSNAAPMAHHLSVETHPTALEWATQSMPKVEIQGDWEFEDNVFDFCLVDSSAPIVDGYHRHEALQAAEPNLEDGAIVVIHDARKRGGAKPMAYCKDSPHFELIDQIDGKTGIASWKYTKPTEETSEWVTDYSDVTLTVACTENYYNKAKYAVQSICNAKNWDGPILYLTVGWDNPKHPQCHRVDVSGANPREQALGALILGGAKHTKTKYSFKIDAETIAENDLPFLKKHYFDYDLVGQKWGYTRGPHMMFADHWIDGLWRAGRIKRGEFKGIRKSYDYEGDGAKPHRLKYKCPRIASGWGRLCSTELLKEIADCHDHNRLVVSSEDSLLSCWVERLDLPWLQVNWKNRGLLHVNKLAERDNG